MNLTEFESRAIYYILRDKFPHLGGEISSISVESRNYTAVGVIVEIRSEQFGNEDESEAFLVGNDVIAKRDDFDDCIRFALEVTNVRINSLEIFSNSGDAFPKEMDGFEFSRI